MNIGSYFQVFPSTDIDQDLNKRASLLLNQTFTARPCDIEQISSTEQALRPMFTQIGMENMFSS